MKKLGILLTMMVVLASCSSLKVSSDFDSSIDFAQYKTYKIMHFADENAIKNKQFNIDDINRKRIEGNLTSEVEGRGYTQSETPDVYFLYAVDIDMQTTYSAHSSYMGGGHYGYRGRGMGGMGSSHTDVQKHEYAMGRLRVAMVDVKSDELLWVGSANQEVKGKKNKDEQVAKIIARIMQEHPIPLSE